jgi:threonine aldolase
MAGAPPTTTTQEAAMAFPDGIADFRSDTVTRPTDAMRRAMADAAVGDDVYGEDPTVNALEEEAAAAIGMEAGLFVPSGVMGNQIALHLLARPGDEILCVATAHVRNYEQGAAAALSGAAFRTLPGPDGEMDADAIEGAFVGAGYHLPSLTTVVWENTHNVSGGTVVTFDHMAAGTAVARRFGAGIHLDGARIWNAAAASGVAAARYAGLADTVMFCLSKGLGAPIGSMLCASKESIEAGRVIRRRFGGAMRQVGVIAAAGRIALAERDRLTDDHAVAAALAAGLHERFGNAASDAATNMVMLSGPGLPASTEQIAASLAAAGIKVGHIRPGVLRFVTHRDVDLDDVRRTLAVLDDLNRS